jgi:NSS family neurotransmitter:Na+ symporter
MALRNSRHGYWSSAPVVLLAAAGAVIGLDNVWRLPYLAVTRGGGAFLLVYALALFFMALPLFIAELIMSRRVRANPVTIARLLAAEARAHPAWTLMGWLALIGVTLVLSYYSVIAGWSMGYMYRAAGGVFRQGDKARVTNIFADFAQAPEKMLAWHTIFMVMVVTIVSHGVRHGLERAARYLVPAAFAALVVFWCFAFANGDMPGAAHAMFSLRFDALGWQGALQAFNEAFFTLSLGAGAMLAVGAYMRGGHSAPATALAVVVLNYLFSLIAGLAIFAVLLAAGMKPEQTVALAFRSIPLALGGVPGGLMATMVFFMLLLLVGLTSAVLLMEPVVMWLVERWQMSRPFAAGAAGTSIWFLGLGSIFSFNLWERVTWHGRTFYEWFAWLTAHLLLPLTGLVICVFVALVMPVASLRQGWGGRGRFFLLPWRWLLRYPARIGLLLVLCYELGLITLGVHFWK